jgi:hypothetical protein
VLLALATPVAAQESNDFQWSIAPYLWASQTKVDLSLRGEAIGGDTISFGDLLDQIDSAFMVAVEGGKGHWSGFADLTVLETSDTEQRPVFLVDTRADTTVLDAGVAWWPEGVDSNLSMIVGVRYTGFDNRYRFSRNGEPVTEVRDTDDYYDALLGLRFKFEVGERWDLHTRADVSFGDSEGTWMARAVLARTVGKREMNRILLGYQYKEADFESGNVGSDFTYHGPLAGFDFRF